MVNGQAIRHVYVHDIKTARPAKALGGRAVFCIPVKVLRQVLVSLAVTAVLIWLLLRWTGTDARAIGTALRGVEPRWYWIALGVQLCIYPLRAARFAALLNHPGWQREQAPATTAALVPVTMAHSLFAYLLPAKVGEASLMWYLHRGFGVPASRGTAVLVASRLLDLVCVTGFLAVACLVVGYGGLAERSSQLVWLGWLLLPLAGVMAWALSQGARLVGVMGKALGPVLRRLGAVGERLQGMLARLQEAFDQIPSRRLGLAALWSPAIWVGVFLFYALLARGLGMQDLSLAEATFGAGLAILFSLLPVSAFAGFGSQDAGWVLGFVAVGVERALAAESGIAIHLIYAAHIVVLGVLGHAWARRRASRSLAGSSMATSADSETS